MVYRYTVYRHETRLYVNIEQKIYQYSYASEDRPGPINYARVVRPQLPKIQARTAVAKQQRAAAVAQEKAAARKAQLARQENIEKWISVYDHISPSIRAAAVPNGTLPRQPIAMPDHHFRQFWSLLLRPGAPDQQDQQDHHIGPDHQGSVLDVSHIACALRELGAKQLAVEVKSCESDKEFRAWLRYSRGMVQGAREPQLPEGESKGIASEATATDLNVAVKRMCKAYFDFRKPSKAPAVEAGVVHARAEAREPGAGRGRGDASREPSARPGGAEHLPDQEQREHLGSMRFCDLIMSHLLPVDWKDSKPTNHDRLVLAVKNAAPHCRQQPVSIPDAKPKVCRDIHLSCKSC